MSATIIDELMISLGIDGSQAKKGMKEATSAISGGIKEITGKLGGLAAAFAGIYSASAAFTEYLSAADSMGKFSDAIGVNIEDLHAWSEAAKRSGGSIEGFQGSLKSLTTQLSKMSTVGKSKAGNVLAAVGIDPGEIGRQRDAFEVLEEIADKMQSMSKQEAMGFGASLGLDSGTIMLLQQGRDGVKDLVRHQRELGVYTKEDARVTAEFNDAIDDTKQAFMAAAAVIFREIVPAIKEVVSWVTKFVSYLRQHETAVKAFFVMLAAIITAMLLPAILSFFAALLANPMTWVILALVALALAIEDLIVWMDGGESALDDFWEALFGSREDAKKLFDDIGKKLKAFWEVLKFVFKYIASGRAWQDMKDHANEAYNLIRDRFMLIRQRISDTWNRLVETVKAPFIRMGEAIDRAKQRFDEFCNRISQLWTSVTNSISNEIMYLRDKAIETWERIRQKCADALSWIETKWGAFKTTASNALNTLLGPIQNAAMWLRDKIGTAIERTKLAFEIFSSTVSQLWTRVTNSIFNEVMYIGDRAIETWEWIRQKCEDALSWIEDKWNALKTTATDALNSLLEPIQNVANWLMDKIGGAIAWVAQKWADLKTTFGAGGGEVFVNHEMSSKFASNAIGGGGTTNNNSSSVNIGSVTLNGVTNGFQASKDFNAGVSRYWASQANTGI